MFHSKKPKQILDISNHLKDGSDLIWTVRSCSLDNSFLPPLFGKRKSEGETSNFHKVQTLSFPPPQFCFRTSERGSQNSKHQIFMKLE